MPRSRRLLAGALLAVSLGAQPSGFLEVKRFRVDSVPEGAEVFVIGGSKGRTPLSLTERDIYPNWYPDDQAHLYGTVILRKAGCAEYSKRLTLEDIGKGLRAQLDCAAQARGAGEPAGGGPAPTLAPPTPAAVARQAQPAEAAAEPAIPAAIMQRRLRQLQVLQELLDDGLISEQEERAIRKRILASP